MPITSKSSVRLLPTQVACTQDQPTLRAPARITIQGVQPQGQLTLRARSDKPFKELGLKANLLQELHWINYSKSSTSRTNCKPLEK